MDRITKHGHKFELLNIMQGMNRYTEIDEIMTQLSTYEDTGLTPSELTAKLAKLAEYENAERDGRLEIKPVQSKSQFIDKTIYGACSECTIREYCSKNMQMSCLETVKTYYDFYLAEATAALEAQKGEQI